MDPGPTHDPRRLSAERLALAQTATLRAGLFLLPLAYSPFTYDQFVLPKLLLARLLVAVLAILFLARVVSTRTVFIKRTPVDIPLLVFLASAALSSVFAENQNIALFGTYSRYDGLLTLATFIALFWLSVQSITDRSEAHVLVRVLLASGYTVGVVAIIQSIHDSVALGLITPAFGSLGNPNVLGSFLALVIALGFGELLAARSMTTRVLLLNVLVVAGLALLLSFSRSSWFATGIAAVFILVTRPERRKLIGVVVPLLAALMVTLAIGYVVAVSGPLGSRFAGRVATLVNPSTAVGSRFGIWTDSLRLIASRPLLGYGPDNVGLVFPRFQTGDWGVTKEGIRQQIDKAHLEVLQVAATQGIVGLAAHLYLLAAFIVTFWRARRMDQALLFAAGWIAYETVIQLNFTSLASAFPFWIFSAAAMVSCDAARSRSIDIDRGRAFVGLGGVVAAGLAVAMWGAIVPYLADVRLREAVDADYAGRHREAQILAADARRLEPQESVYAVEVGNTAFELGEWSAARTGYRDAASLGTFNPLVYRNLGLADRNLGFRTEGREAALKAVELDRFDPANQALLAEFEVGTR
ncbi:MAG TPA: O-antigen ligase family protein [Candidatus Dormibacteraeota bacterium]|nr:O-antigen ligase family protein [Candidatus Dormibacteraeota bacterium]